MHHRNIWILAIIGFCLLSGAGLFYLLTVPFNIHRLIDDDLIARTIVRHSATPSPMSPHDDLTVLQAKDIPNIQSDFTFIAKIPSKWQAEAVAASSSVNIYDPALPGESNLEKSKIFIRTFKAKQFLTLSTVTIHNMKELRYHERPAVRYEIEKKADVSNFPNQPAWRNTRHIVTDIRVSDDSPSIFYVIAKSPELDQSTYDQFLDNLHVKEITISLVTPIEKFHERITKKRFGQYITPEISPIKPERFTGYHTGVDVEFTDSNHEIAVKSIADGDVAYAATSSGYGGVIVVYHTIEGQRVSAIYGHLNPTRLIQVNSKVRAGQQLGVLGEGQTDETDGERKHLHFAIRKGHRVDLLGYVNSRSELINWIDPLTLYPAP